MGIKLIPEFFHSKLRWRRAMNDVVGFQISGVWCEHALSVKDHVKQYFESRFDVKPGLDEFNFFFVKNN